MSHSRRDFIQTAGATAALLAASSALAADDRKAIYKAIDQRHDESVARLQDWLHQQSIAAENIGMAEGCEKMRRLALDA